ncbi:MAG: HYR domain-containing protein [Bacteroidetes bacterium]|nr:HYR domain-containing protein [Bacteroidota bacterium]
MRRIFTFLLFLSITGIANQLIAQVPTCGTNVPFFQVDLTGQPEGEWISPSHSRLGNCCGTSSPDRCTSFEIILDPNAAMINFEIASGAIPPGSMFYQIDCGPQVAVGSPICISGVGPHHLTFCKPGNNENTYRVTSIAKPTFPADDSTRIGCSLPVAMYGLTNITINSIYPGVAGQYNSYLSCTNCSTPDFSPGLGSPAYIDYQICGTPIASACGYVYTCDTVRLYAFPTLNGSVTPNPASFCNGGPGVTLTASASGGNSVYSYIWYNSSSVQVGTGTTYNATAQENFTVEINDGLSSATCPAKYTTVPVTVGQPPVVIAGPAQLVCANDPVIYLNGSVSDATGGVWTGGAGTFDPNDSTLFASYIPTAAEINSGSLTLTLTSYGAGGGCTDDFDQVTITFSDTTDISFTSPSLACYNSTGTITSTVTNGTPPYTYLWSNNSSATSITVGAGTYWLDITDAAGCIHQENVTVTAPSALGITLSSTDVSVDGGSDGTATAVVSGGTAPYSYLWSSGSTSSTATGLSYGIATVTVTDANGCTISESIVVNEPRCNGYDATAVSTDVSCFGGTDGTATASVSGGLAPYAYSWNTSPVSLTAAISGLSAGSYTVTVTDGNACIDVATVSVSEPAQLTNSMTHTDIPVIGDNTGVATANPAGGTPGYTYQWSPGGETTQSISNLFAGTYFVQVDDANLCSVSDSVVINEPPCNNFNIGIISSNVSCNGLSDGSARVVIAHGTAPYTINWSNGQTGINATNLVAGTYTVTVTDASNCTTFSSFTITEPSPLNIGLSPTSVSCFGAGDGTIDLTVSGGTFPYSFVWSTGAVTISTAEDLVNLKPGTYSITVTDDNGCTSSGSTGITQPTLIAATSVKVNATCNGDLNGSINATVTGGTSPYTYAWTGPGSFSATSEDISGLAAGLYILSVTDLNNCTLAASHEVYINQPDTVIIQSILVDCPAAGGSTAAVTVSSITGGSETTYNVSFDNGVTFLGSGIYTTTLPVNSTYQVVAEDENGCTTFAPVTLTIDPIVVVDTVLFNPCIPSGATTISVDVTPLGGDGGPYEVSTDNGVTFNAPGVTTLTLATGNSYNIVVRDSKGCLSLPYAIIIPNELIASAVISSQVSCLGESDGSLNLTVTGGTTPYSYSWTGPSGYTASTEDISGLFEGTYTVTVTDTESCTDNATILLTTVADVTPPFITCPADINVSTDAGLCGATITYLTPVGTDNCPLGTNTLMTAGQASGSFFAVGTTVITYVVTDSVGNNATCSFQAIVADNENPTITCPADVAVNNDPGLCTASSVSLGTPTTNDNCGVATVTNDAPATFAVGTTTVTWTVTDIHGNSITCTQDVVVTDNENPTITCPTDVAVNNDPGLCTASSVSLGTPTTNDNCGVATVTNDAPATFAVGTTTVTWTVTDIHGNSITCTQDVVVTDNENPTITCPADVAVNNDPGLCTASSVSLGTPTTNDNCGVATVTNDAPATFAVGTTTVTWTVTDIHGNSLTCTQDVVVTDNENPTITCPADVAVNNDPGTCAAATVSLGTPTTNDNCGVATVTNDAPATFAVGTTTVTWTVTDIHGNSLTCTQDVVVTDNENPTITCPADVAVNNDPGLCTASSVSLGTPTTNDNCGVATVTNDAPVAFPIGTTVVTWTVTDINGNLVTCTQNVVVTDNENPTITCPADITVSNDNGLCTALVNYTVPFSDNCTGSAIIQTIGLPSGSAFPIGTTSNSFMVTDASGNTSLCSFEITVIDTTIPVITCVPDITVNNTAGACEALVTFSPATAQSGCGSDCVTTLPDGSGTYLGSFNGHHYVLSAVDADWNSANTIATGLGGQLVSINSLAENLFLNSVLVSGGAWTGGFQNPSNPGYSEPNGGWEWQDGNPLTFTNWNIGEPNNGGIGNEQYIQFLSGGGAWNDYNGTFPLPYITEFSCPVMVVQTAGLVSGSNFPVGSTTVTYTAYNANGADASCSFTVTVNDVDNPVITCPSDIAATADAGNCYIDSANVSLGTPVTSDNCGIDTVTNNAPAIFPVGTTTVTWTVTDVNGNSATCTQDVVVTDNENPTITCPADVAVNNDPGLCTASSVSLGTPTTNDNCGVATVTNDAPATFPVGTTTVTWTVTDIHGNSITCTQDVVVTDNENPTITCPADVAVNNDPGLCTASSVSLGTPTTNDNCGVATVTNDAPVTFPVGTTTVTWTVTDIHGNLITCTQDVVVTDNENPTITCPADVAVNNDPGTCAAATVSLGTPTTNDNCGVATVTNDAPATFAVGTTTVTWTVTDIHGNSITCTQDVVVTDNENPTITCPVDVAVNNDPGTCAAATVSLGTPTTNDNCGVATVTNDAPATFPVGTTTVTWTVTDIHGNSLTCTQDVVVTDNENPTITCPADVAVNNDPGLCTASSVSLGTPTTNDNCGVATVTNDAPATFAVGTTTVTWTVTDIHGNSLTCTQDVVVTDNENPTITCPADVAVNNDPGTCAAATVSLGTPTTNDNCGVATVTNDAPATFAVGTTTVTWTVTDIHGNSITCTQDVVVTDNEMPVTTNCPTDTSTCFPLVVYTLPVATDNCGIASIIQTAGLGSGATFPIGTTTEEYEITDIHGNITICSFTVTIYPTPVAAITGTDVTCYAAANGTIDLTVTDGTAPYLYLWNNSATSEDLTNLVPGAYDVTVTDFNGCETTAALFISQPDTITVEMTHTDVTCFGLSDGSITILPAGGTTPYTFDWSNGSTSQDLTALPAGDYDLTLTDANGCTYQLAVTVTQPDSLYATATTIDATCLSTDGTIDLTVYGGVLPYTFNWSNSATTEDLVNVPAGNYQVTITDDNGCQFVYTDSIESTNPVSINSTLEDALCYGDRNGLINVTVLNATEPIHYYWSTGDSTAVLLNLLAGDYTLTVVDSNQCTMTVTYTISQPDSMYVQLSSPVHTGGYNVSTYLGTDGSIDAEVIGGTAPYEYLWSDGSTTEDLSNSTAGQYAVLVTDENGCTVQAGILLTQPFELEMPTGYSPNNDGENDYFVVHGIEAFPDNEIQVYNRWGNLVYSASGYQNEWDGHNNSGEELPDGTYFVILKVTALERVLTGYVDLRRTR